MVTRRTRFCTGKRTASRRLEHPSSQPSPEPGDDGNLTGLHMGPETSETRFALEGFLPLWTIILLGIVLLGLSWWMGRRDARFADRRKIVWLLVLLRTVAVLILLWMLSGPTLVTTVRYFKRKSIALLV